MRYAFHGKFRSTGQITDGVVEAANSEEAFNLLADKGIINVHTVRPLPEEPKLEPPKPALPAPEVVLTQLVEKMNVLIGHVETLLTRPATVITAPARGEGHGSRKAKRRVDNAQDEALKAIFETNLDLRRSIQKLNAMTTGAGATGAPPANAAMNSASAAAVLSAPAPAPVHERSAAAAVARPRERTLTAQPAA